MSSLKDKVIFITGGGSGIGRATAIAAAEAGAKVVVADWNVESAQETLVEVEARGGGGLAVQVDVSQASQVAAAIDKTVATFGRIDSAVNNAGIQGVIADTDECSEENWDRIVSVNLKGVWLCLKYEIQQMKRQGGGRIVNVGSNLSFIGVPGMIAYCASKHGLIGLTKTAGIECAKQNILINAVCPGPTETPLGEKIAKDQPEAMQRLMEGAQDKLLMGRLGQPWEVAKAILFCCSEDANFMIGSVISVDGGYIAQ